MQAMLCGTDHGKAFTGIYQQGLWGGKDYSGIGSSLELNKTSYIPFLQTFLRSVEAQSVVDLGCGDFQCGHSTYDILDSVLSYVGYDVYAPLVERLNNEEQYQSKRRFRFVHLDFCSRPDLVEPADVCILKDVLQHWPTADIVRTLDILCSSGKFRYILICNCCTGARDDKPDIICGQWRPLSASVSPLKRYAPRVLLRFNTKELSVIQPIPRIAFTTSASPLASEYQKSMRDSLGTAWTYRCFLDQDCHLFMQQHPVQFCPDPCKRFNSLSGPHKADFFRLYFLYVNGGVFLDSDVLIHRSLDEFIHGTRLFTVRSKIPGLIFNGIMGCTPLHPLVGEALLFVYHCPPGVEKQDYFWFCRHLYQLLTNNNGGGWQSDVKLWTERETLIGQTDTVATPDGPLIATHYWQSKTVPVPVATPAAK